MTNETDKSIDEVPQCLGMIRLQDLDARILCVQSCLRLGDTTLGEMVECNAVTVRTHKEHAQIVEPRRLVFHL